MATLAINLDETLVNELDRLVRTEVYPDRDRAIQDAVTEKLRRLRLAPLAVECRKLIPAEEQALAEEGRQGCDAWPEY